MGHFWHLHSLAGPVLMLMYPLYASVVAIETATMIDNEQWLAYWIFYSFLTLVEMVLQPLLAWIPIWYDVKLLFVAWLVLPQFRGAAFIYERIVREKLIKQYGSNIFNARSHKDLIIPFKGDILAGGIAGTNVEQILCSLDGLFNQD